MKGMKDIKCSVNCWVFQVLLAGIIVINRKIRMYIQWRAGRGGGQGVDCALPIKYQGRQNEFSRYIGAEGPLAKKLPNEDILHK